jgi:hypothetical protein
MKTNFRRSVISLSILLWSGIFMKCDAQYHCGASFTKGQKFHYSRVDKPDILLTTSGYQQMSKKEKKNADEIFRLGVESGSIKGKNYDFDMTISDIKTGKNGTIYEFEYATPTAKYYSYIACSNDTLYAIRQNKPTASVTSNHDTIGFYSPGIAQYPLTMKVGDLLPVSVDLAYTFPKDVDLTTKRKVMDHVETNTYARESQGYIYTTSSTTAYYKEITQKLTYTLNFNTSTNTYRHVIAEDTIKLGGKSYKAFKIELIFETRVDNSVTNVNADNVFSKWSLNMMEHILNNNINKSPELRMTGYEWFVPEIGVIAKSQMLDKDGSTMYFAILNSVE